MVLRKGTQWVDERVTDDPASVDLQLYDAELLVIRMSHFRRRFPAENSSAVGKQSQFTSDIPSEILAFTRHASCDFVDVICLAITYMGPESGGIFK